MNLTGEWLLAILGAVTTFFAGAAWVFRIGQHTKELQEFARESRKRAEKDAAILRQTVDRIEREMKEGFQGLREEIGLARREAKEDRDALETRLTTRIEALERKREEGDAKLHERIDPLVDTVQRIAGYIEGKKGAGAD